MSRYVRRFASVLMGTIVIMTLASPAEAATSWSRKTPGASGWGSYARSHQTDTMKYTLYDTQAGGDCVYVVFRPQIQWATKVPEWLSVAQQVPGARDASCRALSGSIVRPRARA